MCLPACFLVPLAPSLLIGFLGVKVRLLFDKSFCAHSDTANYLTAMNVSLEHLRVCVRLCVPVAFCDNNAHAHTNTHMYTQISDRHPHSQTIVTSKDHNRAKTKPQTISACIVSNPWELACLSDHRVNKHWGR